MENEVTIKRMGLGDLSQVIELGLYTPELKTGTEFTQFYSMETLNRWIESPNGALLTALVNNDFAGFSITGYNPDSRDGYINCITIKQNYRGRGIGSKLINETLNNLKVMGCNNVYCLVKVDNEKTKRFFNKHGFEVGEKFNYVQRSL